MERTRASAAPVDRGDRIPVATTTAPAGRHPAHLAAVVLTAVVVTVLVGTVLVGTVLATVGVMAPGVAVAGAAGTTGGGAGGTGPDLTLVRQSWTVGPGQTFQATLAVGGAGAGPGSAGGLGAAVVVYSPLHTRSALAQTMAGTVAGVVTYRSATVPLTALLEPAPGQFQLDVALATPDDPSPPTAGTDVGPVRLDCAGHTPGSCGGVYPVAVELTGSGGSVLSTLVTLLVYAYPAGSPYRTASPLQLATVVPLDLPVTAAGTVTAGALAELGRSATATVSGTTGAVPLTLVPEPAAVDTLTAAGRAADHQALSDLDAAAADPAHEVLTQTYLPVDPTGLVDAGLADELADQQARACAALAPEHPTLGPWVANATVDDATAAALGQTPCDPVRQLVVPATSVTGGGCTITCAAPFTVDDGAGTVTAVEADEQLAADATAASGGVVLRAHDTVADLSLTYYEAPAPAQPRGVVLALPPGAPFPSGELSSLLAGVAADPVLAPVTLSQFFAQVPVGANGQLATRRLDGSASGLPTAVVRALRADRAQLSAYGRAVDSTAAGTAAATTLDDHLLASESGLLRPTQQLRAVAAFADALHRQLARVSLSTGVVRLTSSSVLRVPITMANTSGYPVAGTLTVSSDKLVFAPAGTCHGIDASPAGYNGLSCLVDLTKSTDPVYVSLRARTGGDFRMAVAFTAPAGHLTLAHGDISVRSLSTSVEGIVLSLAALAVLLTWWARTTWRGRRRRGRHAAGPGGGRGGTAGAAPRTPAHSTPGP